MLAVFETVRYGTETAMAMKKPPEPGAPIIRLRRTVSYVRRYEVRFWLVNSLWTAELIATGLEKKELRYGRHGGFDNCIIDEDGDPVAIQHSADLDDPEEHLGPWEVDE